MKILHAIPSLVEAAGGPTVALVGLVTALARQGHDVTVVTTLGSGEVAADADRLASCGVHVVSVGPCSPPLWTHPKLADVVDSLVGQTEVVHTHGVWEDIQYRCALTCRKLGIPYVMRPCGSLDTWSLRVKPLRKLAYRKWRLDSMLAHAAAIHCTTEWERESTAEVVRGTRFITEPNGVQLDDFRSLPDPHMRLPDNVFGTHPVIGYLGRIHPGKGLEYLVPALSMLRATSATLIAAGPDSHGYRKVVESLAIQHGVRDRVSFTGLLRDKSKVDMLCGTDLFVMVSEHENFGIAVVEAMASGCPVIVSDQVGIKSDVVRARCGAVVPLDPTAIAQEIDRWLEDPRRCRAAGARGRSFALTEYDWDEIARRWCSHYEDLLNAY